MQTIKLNSSYSQRILIYFLLSGLVMVFIVSTAIFVYLDRKAQNVQYSGASSQSIDGNNEDQKVLEDLVSSQGKEEQGITKNGDSSYNTGEAGQYRVEVDTKGTGTLGQTPEVHPPEDSDVDLYQDRDAVREAMRTGLLGVTSQKIEDDLYTISDDKKQILKNGKPLVGVRNGVIEKFVKVGWLDKVFVMVKLNNRSYAVKEFTLLGTSPVERLMYRYEGVYKMTNFYVPSEFIEEAKSPALFFIFYVYDTPQATRFMVQKVKGFVSSNYIIKKYAGTFGGVQEVSFNKDKESITVDFLVGDQVIRETFFND